MRRSIPARMALRLRDVGWLLLFLRRRRFLWVVLVVFLLILTIVLYLAQTAAVTPYIYPLF